MIPYLGTTGSVRVATGYTGSGGGVEITIRKKTNKYKTTLHWQDARKLAYSILRIVDRQLDRELTKQQKEQKDSN